MHVTRAISPALLWRRVGQAHLSTKVSEGLSWARDLNPQACSLTCTHANMASSTVLPKLDACQALPVLWLVSARAKSAALKPWEIALPNCLGVAWDQLSLVESYSQRGVGPARNMTSDICEAFGGNVGYGYKPRPRLLQGYGPRQGLDITIPSCSSVSCSYQTVTFLHWISSSASLPSAQTFHFSFSPISPSPPRSL